MAERYHHVQPGTVRAACGRLWTRFGVGTYGTAFWSVVTCRACLKHRPEDDRTCDIDGCDGHHCVCGAHVDLPGQVCQICGIDP